MFNNIFPMYVYVYVCIKGVLTNGNADLTSSEHPNELAEFLNFSISAVETGAMKPSHVPYLTVLHRTNIHPSRILFIGDSLRTDIMGANMCGMHSVLIDRVNDPPALVDEGEEGQKGQNYDHLNDMIDVSNSACGATSRDIAIRPDIYLGMYFIHSHSIVLYTTYYLPGMCLLYYASYYIILLLSLTLLLL